MIQIDEKQMAKVSGAASDTEAILTGGGALLGAGAGAIACSPVPVAVPFCEGTGAFLGGIAGNAVFEHFFNH